MLCAFQMHVHAKHDGTMLFWPIAGVDVEFDAIITVGHARRLVHSSQILSRIDGRTFGRAHCGVGDRNCRRHIFVLTIIQPSMSYKEHIRNSFTLNNKDTGLVYINTHTLARKS